MSYFADVLEPRMMQQFRDDPMHQEFLKAFGAQVDSFFSACSQVRDSLNIDKATGVSLEYIADRVGLARQDSETDANLRIRIKNANKLRADGTTERIIKILKETHGATNVKWQPEYPAGQVLFWDGTLGVPSQATLEKIASAGVRIARGFGLIDGGGNYIVDGNGNYIYGL